MSRESVCNVFFSITANIYRCHIHSTVWICDFPSHWQWMLMCRDRVRAHLAYHVHDRRPSSVSVHFNRTLCQSACSLLQRHSVCQFQCCSLHAVMYSNIANSFPRIPNLSTQQPQSEIHNLSINIQRKLHLSGCWVCWWSFAKIPPKLSSN